MAHEAVQETALRAPVRVVRERGPTAFPIRPSRPSLLLDVLAFLRESSGFSFSQLRRRLLTSDLCCLPHFNLQPFLGNYGFPWMGAECSRDAENIEKSSPEQEQELRPEILADHQASARGSGWPQPLFCSPTQLNPTK
jgi:hypothetical protein